jgi:hypothetical protein
MKVPRLFSANQYARAFGCDAREVYRWTAGIEPACSEPFKLWPVHVLPRAKQAELEAKAKAAGYRSVEELMDAPVEFWKSPVKWPDVQSRFKEKAALLQRALAPSVNRLADPSLRKSEFERLGVEDYKRTFNRPKFSTRAWRDT